MVQIVLSLDSKFDKGVLKSVFAQIFSTAQSNIIVASFPKNGWMLDWKNIMRKKPQIVIGFRIINSERFPFFLEITIINDELVISTHRLIKQLYKFLNCQILLSKGSLPSHVIIYETDEHIRRAYIHPDIYPVIKIIKYDSLLIQEEIVNFDSETV